MKDLILLSRTFQVSWMPKALLNADWCANLILRNFIDNDRQWLIFQLEHIKNLCEGTDLSRLDRYRKSYLCRNLKKETPTVQSISERFEILISRTECSVVVQQFSRKESISKLKEFVKHMWFYLNDESISYYRNPLDNAMAKHYTGFAELVIDSGHAFNYSISYAGNTQ